LFKGWEAYLPADVEVCAIQLPGRGPRMDEAVISNLAELASLLAVALQPLQDRPFAFFGHSMGALISYELAHTLRKHNASLPVHLFVSARPAPHLPLSRTPIHHLPDDKFMAALEGYNGTPAAVLQNRELMDLFLPALRADFAISERYSYVAEEPLACSISAFGGVQDDLVSRASLAAWCEHTRGTFSSRLFPGDHFFLHSAQPLLLRALAQTLQQLLETDIHQDPTR
jgi:medium-chain acyl-[acyl-carrier-protein] hydrolase